MSTLITLRKELKSKANSKKAKILQRFFKTGKGEYGEGDIFLGIAVPEIRKIARKYSGLKLKEISELLKSKIHEERLLALLILVDKFQGASINGSKQILYRLAKSKNLWERRIAILATYAFIKNNQFGETLKISEMLLNDNQGLIHKAVGWMLREVGKRSQKTLEKFLKIHYQKMPRTMLRYAIERLTSGKRRGYLKN